MEFWCTADNVITSHGHCNSRGLDYVTMKSYCECGISHVLTLGHGDEHRALFAEGSDFLSSSAKCLERHDSMCLSKRIAFRFVLHHLQKMVLFSRAALFFVMERGCSSWLSMFMLLG